VSRSGYSDDIDDELQAGRWLGMVASAIRGKRGQKFLCELVAALDAMPIKELIMNELEEAEENGGGVCALGALGKARGLDMRNLDPEETRDVAEAFNIAECLAAEVAYQNDECSDWYFPAGSRWEQDTPYQRWVRMRAWAISKIMVPK
jgi:hypothetical protein